jgi:CheY-like chemotaxis protein/predicted DNA-binding protein (UPF0251 family)
MGAFEEFEQHLQDTLAHLYDPAYHPPELLWRTMGYRQPQSTETIRRVILEAIESLKPAPDVPPAARVRRLYELLSYRYIQELTQKETAQRLGITPRHLRREQQQAVHLLAQRLWERSQWMRPRWNYSDDYQVQSPESLEGDGQTEAWRDQVRQELLSLQRSAPGIVADVGETIRGVIELEKGLSLQQGIALEAGVVPHGLLVLIHPSALRQVLITAIQKLAQHMATGRIVLDAFKEANEVKIRIAGSPMASSPLPKSEFIQEILAAQGGSVGVYAQGDEIAFELGLLSADERIVLVIDDNADLVHFYRRYAEGTRYRIVHIPEGKNALWAIERYRPDVIVLDVMLPDVDGWSLLSQLHEHPVTRHVPVIVCSVVRREELALALGASLYLPKPVRRQEFICALDQALEICGGNPLHATPL